MSAWCHYKTHRELEACKLCNTSSSVYHFDLKLKARKSSNPHMKQPAHLL